MSSESDDEPKEKKQKKEDTYSPEQTRITIGRIKKKPEAKWLTKQYGKKLKSLNSKTAFLFCLFDADRGWSEAIHHFSFNAKAHENSGIPLSTVKEMHRTFLHVQPRSLFWISDVLEFDVKLKIAHGLAKTIYTSFIDQLEAKLDAVF